MTKLYELFPPVCMIAFVVLLVLKCFGAGIEWLTVFTPLVLMVGETVIAVSLAEIVGILTGKDDEEDDTPNRPAV